MQKVFTVVAFVLYGFVSFGQISVSAQLDTADITIGDQVQMHIYVNHTAGIEVRNIDLSVLQEMEKVEVIDTHPVDTLHAGGEFVLEQRLTLTSFDSGYHWLPKIPIMYLENGQPKVASTNDLRLRVSTFPITSDSASLAPIKTIIEEPLKFRDTLPFLGGGIFLIALISALVFLLKKRKKAEAPPPPEVSIPPHEVAIDKLNALEKTKLWQQGKVKEYQSELTYIVREYLESRFHFLALESASHEIIHELKKLNVEQEWIDKLQQMFATADLVKFAKGEPPVEVHARLMEEAREFVLHNKQNY